MISPDHVVRQRAVVERARRHEAAIDELLSREFSSSPPSKVAHYDGCREDGDAAKALVDAYRRAGWAVSAPVDIGGDRVQSQVVLRISFKMPEGR